MVNLLPELLTGPSWLDLHCRVLSAQVLGVLLARAASLGHRSACPSRLAGNSSARCRMGVG